MEASKLKCSPTPEFWADPKGRSTLRFHNPHHGSTRVRNWGIYLVLLFSPRGLDLSPELQPGHRNVPGALDGTLRRVRQQRLLDLQKGVSGRSPLDIPQARNSDPRHEALEHLPQAAASETLGKASIPPGGVTRPSPPRRQCTTIHHDFDRARYFRVIKVSTRTASMPSNST